MFRDVVGVEGRLKYSIEHQNICKMLNLKKCRSDLQKIVCAFAIQNVLYIFQETMDVNIRKVILRYLFYFLRLVTTGSELLSAQ